LDGAAFAGADDLPLVGLALTTADLAGAVCFAGAALAGGGVEGAAFAPGV
jgi:hypothetical protein